MASGSKKVVLAALFGNGAIAVTKFTAAAITGSSAMFSEAIHSLVDTSNQGLLLYGLNKSKKPADKIHPLGYGRELYFWAFMVAILVFALGGGISFYEGIHKLTAQSHEMTSPYINYIVLILAMIFEGAATKIAFKEFNKTRGNTPIFKAIRESKDPAVFAVLLEDTAALIGLTFALVGVFCAHILHIYWADAFASIVIGVLLFIVAIIMALEAKSLLIGEAASPAVTSKIQDILHNHKNIEKVNNLTTSQLSPDYIVALISLDLMDNLSTVEIENLVTDLKNRIANSDEKIKHIIIEAQDNNSYLS